jgi:hypothetical protein
MSSTNSTWLLTSDSSIAAGPDQLTIWKARGKFLWRSYREAPQAPGPQWEALNLLANLPGASHGQAAPYHYVVETDVAPEHEAQFNAWYRQEHLPGLASVPGTVRARRYLRNAAGPRYYACYDLTSLDVLNSSPWLAVRNTAWSYIVRPTFVGPVRTEFELG